MERVRRSTDAHVQRSSPPVFKWHFALRDVSSSFEKFKLIIIRIRNQLCWRR